MLHARLLVDLPSKLPKATATSRLVSFLVGKTQADEKLEQVLLDNLSVFEQLLLAFGEAGFNDVVSVVVDGKPAYVDVEETIGDLSNALEGTVRSGFVNDGFAILRTTFCRMEGSLRILAELKLRPRVPEGQEEVVIRFSARDQETDVGDDEGPREYAARMREYIRKPEAVREELQSVQAAAQRVAESIPRTIEGARVTARGAWIRVIALGPRQVGRLRHLGFRTMKRGTVYHSLPTFERLGAYDDPINLHYYSPYQDLFDWIALGEILDGHWAFPDLEVVHPTGHVLFTGDRAKEFDPKRLEVSRDAVRVSPEGKLVVDDSIPVVSNFDVAEVGNPHSPGWAGEQWAADIES